MRHRNHRYRLGRTSEHRTAMLRNLLVSLFRHERVTTTEAKAKAVRALADRMITLAKRESLHARRQVLAMMPDRQVVARLFDQIAARFGDRPGGYTRIIHAGVRRGDAAPLVYLELVDRAPSADGKGRPGDKARKKETRRKDKAAAGA
jgi:large subunit ribosomal protein L17